MSVCMLYHIVLCEESVLENSKKFTQLVTKNMERHKYLAKTKVISDETTAAPTLQLENRVHTFPPLAADTEIKHIFFFSLCHLHRVCHRARSNRQATCFLKRITTPRMIYACTQHKSSSATIGAKYIKHINQNLGLKAAGGGINKRKNSLKTIL